MLSPAIDEGRRPKPARNRRIPVQRAPEGF
jgi:hypothetical protein